MARRTKHQGVELVLNAYIYGDIYANVEISQSFMSPFFNDDNIIGEKTKSINYLSFDGSGVDLVKNQKFYEIGDFAGSTYPTMSNESGIITPQSFTQGFLFEYSGEATITVRVSNESCSKMTIVYVDEDNIEQERETASRDDDIIKFKLNGDYTRAYAYPSETPYPYQYARFNGIIACDTTVLTKFKSHTLTEELNVISYDLPLNEFTAEINSDEEIVPSKSQRLDLFSNGTYYGAYYVYSVERTSEKIYTVTAYDIMQKLENVPISWFTLNGLSAGDLIDKISEDGGVAIDYENNDLKIKLKQGRYTHFDDPQATPLGIYHDRYQFYGQIENSTIRYLLCCLCFAMGKIPYVARQDKIIIKDLPTQTTTFNASQGLTTDLIKFNDIQATPTSIIDNESRRILGEATFTLKDAVSKVTAIFSVPFADENTREEITYPANSSQQIEGYSDSPSYWLKILPTGTSPIGKQTPFKFENTAFSNTNACYKYALNFTDYYYSTINPNITEQNGQEEQLSNIKLAMFECRDSGWYYNPHSIGMPVVYFPVYLDLLRYAKSRGTVSAKIILNGEKVGDYVEIETAWQGRIRGIITKMTTTFGFDDISEIEVIEW